MIKNTKGTMGRKTKHLSINSSKLLLLGNLAWTQCLASSYRPRPIRRALSQMIQSNNNNNKTEEKDFNSAKATVEGNMG